MESNFKWIFLLRSSKYIYVMLPFVLVLGYIYRYYRSKQILSKWEVEEELDNIE